MADQKKKFAGAFTDRPSKVGKDVPGLFEAPEGEKWQALEKHDWGPEQEFDPERYRRREEDTLARQMKGGRNPYERNAIEEAKILFDQRLPGLYEYLGYIEGAKGTPEQEKMLRENINKLFNNSLRDVQSNIAVDKKMWGEGKARIDARIDREETLRKERVKAEAQIRKEKVTGTITGAEGETRKITMPITKAEKEPTFKPGTPTKKRKEKKPTSAGIIRIDKWRKKNIDEAYDEGDRLPESLLNTWNAMLKAEGLPEMEEYTRITPGKVRKWWFDKAPEMQISYRKKRGPMKTKKKKKIVRRGIYQGRKVVQYEDGSTEYAD